jgi:hypothetical protein
MDKSDSHPTPPHEGGGCPPCDIPLFNRQTPDTETPAHQTPWPTGRLSRRNYAGAGFAAAAVVTVLATMQPACAERVTIEYEAEARTITNQPFGITVPFLTVVRGYFTYETNTPDQTPADLMRGRFLLSGTWDFRAEFLDKVITGSGFATATTNLFGYTLAFNDGGGTADRGIMAINDLLDPDIEFVLSIKGEAKDLPTDQLPENFTFDPPPNVAPHTFVLKDDSGQMNLRFLSFHQVRPKILSIQRTGDDVEIVWSSVKGKPYALEFSTNLRDWTIIRADLIGLPLTTSVVDHLAARHSGNPPPKGFYRILDPTSPP